MAGYIGSIETFDEDQQDWVSYSERLEQYFLINDVRVEKRVPALLSIIGSKAYELLRNLTAPDKPSTKSYAVLVGILKDHLNPKPSIIAERFRFHKRDQQDGETISDYVAELKRLSLHCNFGENLNDAVRDRLVCGLRSESIQKRLLSDTELEVKKAVALAVAMETAAKDSIELRNRGQREVNKLSRRPEQRKDAYVRPSNNRNDNEVPGDFCFRCGKRHNPETCYFKNEECHNCHRRGHIARKCLQRRKAPTFGQRPWKTNKVHTVDQESEGDSDLADSVIANIGVTEKDVHTVDDAIWVHPNVAGKTLKMELDTGSAVSIVSLADYLKLYKHLDLQPTEVLLRSYTGERIKPKGKLRVPVKYKNQRSTLDLYVVSTRGPALLGRDWLRQIKLDWPAIKAVQVDMQTTCKSTEDKLKHLLEQYSDVFKDEIGALRGTEAKLVMKDNSRPVFHKARQVPYALRPKIELELDRLEEAGVLSKVDWSEWASPIVPVVKRNGAVRICGDFKVSINPQIQVDQYPLPRVEDVFATLSGGKKFSKLDLRQAYLQMPVEEKSKEYLTVNTHKGLYRYNRLAFGVASAPAVWQRTMDQVLAGIPKVQCIIDDMIITGESNDEHLHVMELVLKRLQEHGLRVNPEKCEFFKDKMTYCAHEITAEGLQKTADKVKAMVDAPRPKDVSQLRSMLGLINYYHRFLPDLSTLLHPLHQLLKKDQHWAWTSECEAAFQEVKQLISSDMVLTHYDPQKPLRIASDASSYGLGSVLSHVMEDGSERPIAFASRSLTQSERNYSQIDKEALALVWGVKKFHHYVYGRKFTLVTDHKPLLSILHPHKSIPVITAARLQRYALFLAGHNYNIEYKRTTDHCNADALSRLPLEVVQPSAEDDADAVDVFYTSQIGVLPVTSADIKRETQRDVILSRVVELVHTGWTSAAKDIDVYYGKKDELSVYDGCLWGMRVIVPQPLRERVLDQLHEGHIGMVKMKVLARSYVWWPSIDKDIEHSVKGCVGCQLHQNMPQAAPLHPWEWPSGPWQRIHIDYAGPFLGSMFLVVVDAHSKWPESFVMKSTTSQQTIQKLREIFSRNGLPEQLVSDNGPQFTSEEFGNFMKQNGIKHIKSAPYHPATNGLAERFVQTLKAAFRSTKGEDGAINRKLAQILLAYRNTPHSRPTTGQSPAKLFLGRPLRSRMDILKPNTRKTVNDKLFQRAIGKQEGSMREFHEGQSVLVRDYRGNQKWVVGIVKSRSGPLGYEVEVGPCTWKRHVDQMRNTRLTTEANPTTEPPVVGSDQSRSALISPQPPNTGVEGPETPESREIPGSETVVTPSVRRYPQRQRKAPDRLDL